MADDTNETPSVDTSSEGAMSSVFSQAEDWFSIHKTPWKQSEQLVASFCWLHRAKHEEWFDVTYKGFETTSRGDRLWLHFEVGARGKKEKAVQFFFTIRKTQTSSQKQTDQVLVTFTNKKESLQSAQSYKTFTVTDDGLSWTPKNSDGNAIPFSALREHLFGKLEQSNPAVRTEVSDLLSIHWSQPANGNAFRVSCARDTDSTVASASLFSLLAIVSIVDAHVNAVHRSGLGLPDKTLLYPKRTVALVAEALLDVLQERGLFFPPHLIEAACTSLNSGKSVIFTGPPGCGKTELACFFATWGMASIPEEPNTSPKSKEPLVCTANAGWTSSELVGRYWPDTNDANRLVFKEGFFLRAFNEARWLVIDELNRAPFNECLGELFTVLSGQHVELPFSDAEGKPIVVAPQGKSLAEGKTVYTKLDSFRFIGTMNDADRASLTALSFALLRRVDVLRVDAPEGDHLTDAIKGRLEKSISTAQLTEFGFKYREKKYVSTFDLLEASGGVFGALVQNAFNDLLKERIVGVATCLESIDFVVEGLRAPNNEKAQVVAGCKGIELAASYLAMALVLKVIPQLEGTRESVEKDSKRTISKCFEAFDDYDFVRVTQAKQTKSKAEDPFAAERMDPPLKCGEFLRRELARYLPGYLSGGF